ncbi:DUF427 domain-containing protein [Bacillus sp. FJAT-27264]|uniref:DUF427 domain-containing protein n=1 Tax=Paenibacillus sp. (strain DSM 101736 / FJAT-27264) TaxID=1850362 RepID=UPI0009F32A5A|nr:DUF427 domain-containing protein [Bacillus sp. FJAT-27264]
MAHYDPQWNLNDEFDGDWQLRAEVSPKWIRVKIGETFVADSRRVLIVTETGKLPVYYFPKEDVRTEFLQESTHRREDLHKGEAVYWNIGVDDTLVENAVWSHPNPSESSAIIAGYITFIWRNKEIRWFEEEEEVINHARDPYSRLDAIPSSRHIKVIVGGKVVADSQDPVILFETGLTPRFYLPKEDINFDYLVPTDTVTTCPYKGTATYHSFNSDGVIAGNVVWSYQEPLPEVHEIAGRYSFYNEEVDAIYIDGEKWSLQGQDRLPYKSIAHKQ